jgi:hypothetical protein
MRRSEHDIEGATTAAPWLLLIYQLPPQPAYLRVKVWRRLQGLGAISVKNSVYVLPASEQALEDFQWLLREIDEGGGEGMICQAQLVDGLSDQEVRALFDAARDADYDEIATELRNIAADVGREAKTSITEKSGSNNRLRRLRRHFAEVSAIDFFSATGRMTVEALLSDLEARLVNTPAHDATEGEPAAHNIKSLAGKTWVTRRSVHVDRIACAWLIRRFIDPEARFKFVSAKDYEAQPGELRFDMFQAEFTHEGDRCSFEVLLERVGLEEPALRAIAEIVHDIDLKDAKFERDEAPGVARLIVGVATASRSDEERLERGGALFDDLYESFRRKRGAGR